MSVLENIKESIMNANSILILTHENPDGDAIGSSLALYNAFKKIEKKQNKYKKYLYQMKYKNQSQHRFWKMLNIQYINGNKTIKKILTTPIGITTTTKKTSSSCSASFTGFVTQATPSSP